MTTKAAPKPKKEDAPAKKRKRLYNEVIVELKVGEFALTVERCKELMDWTTDEERAKKADAGEPLLLDLAKQKVWCLNNLHNRPLYMDVVEHLIQEHLNLRWEFNGEPIIIGANGTVENGQHQMAALILADQHRLIDGEGKQWAKNWPGPLTMEKVVIYGIEETDRVIDTMDTCKPRSLTDVIYRSSLFGKIKGGDLKVLSRMLDSCVRLLWHRTGASNDAFAPRRTHAEGMEFIRHHPRTVRAVKHIWEEYQSGSAENDRKNWIANNRRLGAGYAAALLYLMGACETDGAEYQKMDTPGEKKVDWEHWDMAAEFWTKFATSDPELADVHRSLGYLVDPDTNVGGTTAERLTIIIKAWNLYREGRPIKVKDIEPEYKENEMGRRLLAAVPTVGGIDVGSPRKQTAPDADEVEGTGPVDPTTEDVEEAAKEASPKPKAPKPTPRPKPAPKPKQ